MTLALIIAIRIPTIIKRLFHRKLRSIKSMDDLQNLEIKSMNQFQTTKNTLLGLNPSILALLYRAQQKLLPQISQITSLLIRKTNIEYMISALIIAIRIPTAIKTLIISMKILITINQPSTIYLMQVYSQAYLTLRYSKRPWNNLIS